MANRYMKSTNIINHEGKANQNQNNFTAVKMVIIRKITTVGEDVDVQFYGNVNWCSHYGKYYDVMSP